MRNYRLKARYSVIPRLLLEFKFQAVGTVGLARGTGERLLYVSVIA